MKIKEQYKEYLDIKNPFTNKNVKELMAYLNKSLDQELKKYLFEGTYEKETTNQRTVPYSSLYPRQEYLQDKKLPDYGKFRRSPYY